MSIVDLSFDERRRVYERFLLQKFSLLASKIRDSACICCKPDYDNHVMINSQNIVRT